MSHLVVVEFEICKLLCVVATSSIYGAPSYAILFILLLSLMSVHLPVRTGHWLYFERRASQKSHWLVHIPENYAHCSSFLFVSTHYLQ